MLSEGGKRWAVVGAAMVGLLLGLWATSMGVFATPDSGSYVGRADQVRAGGGLTLPFLPDGEHISSKDLAAETTAYRSSHFPPLYSAVLALGPITSTARFIDVICLAANLALIVVLVGRLSDWHPVALLLAVFLALADADFAMVHTAALSEPMAMTLSLSALLLLDEGFRRARPAPWVAGFVVCGGLALLARYAAVSVLIAGAIAILCHQRWSLRARLATVVAIGVAVVPTMAWMVLGGGGTRTMTFHGLRAAQGNMLGEAAIDWLVPRTVPANARSLFAWVIAAGLVAAWVLTRRERAQHDVDEVIPASAETSELRRLLWLYLGAQVAVQIGTLLFLDIGTESRLLVPAHVLFVVGVVSLAGLGRQTSHRLAPRIVTSAVILIILFQLSVVLGTFGHSATVGPYASLPSLDADSRGPELSAALHGLPKDSLVISNAPSRVYLVSKRHSVSVPSKWYSTTGVANPAYDHELDIEGKAIHDRHGVVVMVNGVDKIRTWLPTAKELEQRWGLHAVSKTDNFVVLAPDDGQWSTAQGQGGPGRS